MLFILEWGVTKIMGVMILRGFVKLQEQLVVELVVIISGSASYLWRKFSIIGFSCGGYSYFETCTFQIDFASVAIY